MVPLGSGSSPFTSPFGVAATRDGRWAFVATGDAVDVLRIGASLGPEPVRTIALPRTDGGPPGPSQALGVALTPDGRDLLLAGAIVVDVARAEQGLPGAVLGTLSAPPDSGAIEVAVSPDGNFAFVSEEDSRDAAVFDLRAALTRGFKAGDFVGNIPLGLAPVGFAISPGGRWLYVTSEDATVSPVSGGTLSVIDLRKAETRPASSVVATVRAGCQPVRVAASADGREVWVDARGSDDLLCFSAARLLSDPGRALVAIVRVGEAPVGLALVRGGSRIVVADSNRFVTAGAGSDLGVVNVADALAGKPAFLGRIRAGQFPRDMAVEPDGRVLLVANYQSGQLEAVSVPALP